MKLVYITRVSLYLLGILLMLSMIVSLYFIQGLPFIVYFGFYTVGIMMVIFGSLLIKEELQALKGGIENEMALVRKQIKVISLRFDDQEQG